MYQPFSVMNDIKIVILYRTRKEHHKKYSNAFNCINISQPEYSCLGKMYPNFAHKSKSIVSY